MNIFHKLAEKAFEGRYFPDSIATIANDIYQNGEHKAYRFWTDQRWDSFCSSVYHATNDEQALALLFIGEMYETQ